MIFRIGIRHLLSSVENICIFQTLFESFAFGFQNIFYPTVSIGFVWNIAFHDTNNARPVFAKGVFRQVNNRSKVVFTDDFAQERTRLAALCSALRSHQSDEPTACFQTRQCGTNVPEAVC